MRGKTYSEKEKKKVRQLILEGKSYNEITILLGVPKSTTSTWFGKTLKRPVNRKVMLEHLANIRKLAGVALRKNGRKNEKKKLS